MKKEIEKKCINDLVVILNKTNKEEKNSLIGNYITFIESIYNLSKSMHKNLIDHNLLFELKSASDKYYMNKEFNNWITIYTCKRQINISTFYRKVIIKTFGQDMKNGDKTKIVNIQIAENKEVSDELYDWLIDVFHNENEKLNLNEIDEKYTIETID